MSPIALTIVAILALCFGVAALLFWLRTNKLRAELAGSVAQCETQAQELTNKTEEVVQLKSDLEEIQSSKHALGSELERQKDELDQYKGGIELLWTLELMRSERTWRQSVAIQPDELSPFSTAQDALRLALETETTALREDVGAAIDIEFNGKIGPRLSQLLTLRSAQELLARAAFEQVPVVFTVTANDVNITLELAAPNADDSLSLELPKLDSPLLTLQKNGTLKIMIR